MICCLEFGGGGRGTAALKGDPRGFIQQCKTKFRISRAVAENVLFWHRRAKSHKGSSQTLSWFTCDNGKFFRKLRKDQKRICHKESFRTTNLIFWGLPRNGEHTLAGDSVLNKTLFYSFASYYF